MNRHDPRSVLSNLESTDSPHDAVAPRIRRMLHQAGRVLLFVAVVGAIAHPDWPQQEPGDLGEESIEDLMNIQVTSVSKKEQKLSQTASAIFVITAEDIDRSGASNIPDLLRMVPGVDVAQINANSWAITARGFNGRFSNELMVMVDGRSVYTPTSGGVFWDVLDIPLEDIERIEVIRGPGGSVWGGNAVNGVISIITKKAAETKGGMLTGGGGNLNQGFGATQYGGRLGKGTDYRAYTMYFGESELPNQPGQGGANADGWHMLRGGFRTDSSLSPKDTLTVQGDLYDGREGVPTSFTFPIDQLIDTQVNLSGGFLQAFWNHTYSTRSDLSLQVSYDAYGRSDVLGERRKTLNVDFQHHFAWGHRQDIVWGLGYRDSQSRSDGITVSLNPPDLNTQLFSSFIQDEITLVPDRFHLTVGTKLEHNYYTGFALMPTARVTYTPSGHLMFWAAVSRAVRTPADTDTSIRVNFAEFPGANGTPILVSLLGNPHFKNEGLTAYEAGYRTSVLNRLSFDFAAYYNVYSNQQTTEPSSPFFETTPAPPHLVVPSIYQNLMHGESHGVEVGANWKVTNRWTLSPGYAFEQIHMHLDPSSQDTTSVGDTQGSSPTHSAQLRSRMDLPDRLSWNTSVYFVNRLPAFAIPSYTRLDTELTWRWAERSSVSIVGQNLLKNQHLEFEDATQSAQSSLMKRSVYAQFTWRF